MHTIISSMETWWSNTRHRLKAMLSKPSLAKIPPTYAAIVADAR